MVTSNAATEYVAKISMLRLNIGSGMLRLSSCMLRLGLRLPYAVLPPQYAVHRVQGGKPRFRQAWATILLKGLKHVATGDNEQS